ncbi:MAG TPA: hypothetical protein PLZ84_06735 [Clostridia bacterium]|nr:hypothetical protein [Clostridia bacterium]
MGRYLYTLNSGEGTVSITDTATLCEVKRIDLDIRVQQRRGLYLSPKEIISDKQNSRVYILCPFDDLLVCCSTELDRVLYCVSVPSNPLSMALSPDGVYIYVACADSDSIMQLSAISGRQLAMVRTRPNPIGVYADKMLLCACMNGRCVTSFDLKDVIPQNTVALKGMPFAITGSNGEAIVTQLTCDDESNGCVSFLEAENIVPIRHVRLNITPARVCALACGYAIAENGGDRLRFYNTNMDCTGEVITGGGIDRMLYDEAQDVLYASIPEINAVAVYDCAEQVERYRFTVGLEPGGMVIVNRKDFE